MSERSRLRRATPRITPRSGNASTHPRPDLLSSDPRIFLGHALGDLAPHDCGSRPNLALNRLGGKAERSGRRTKSAPALFAPRPRDAGDRGNPTRYRALRATRPNARKNPGRTR